MIRHVIWDWNGTLFDDFDIVLSAMSSACVSAGGTTITADRYRQTFTRPIERTYERLLGRPLHEGEWERLNDQFHVSYNEICREATLAPEAPVLLQRLREKGVTQSLLSMWEHDELVPFVEGYGVAGYFVRIDGQPRRSGDHKREYLRAHVERLAEVLPGGRPPDEMLLVGDSVDDAHAAHAVGVHCVLLDSGPHERDHFLASGAPVASTLSEALRLGGVLV